MPLPCVLDCDPGHDDAVAILLAASLTELDLRAITTVGGNGVLERTTENARRVATLARLDVPIAAGAAGPLRGDDLVTAPDVHGESALDGPCCPRLGCRSILATPSTCSRTSSTRPASPSRSSRPGRSRTSRCSSGAGPRCGRGFARSC